jgi:hypothetical protein
MIVHTLYVQINSIVLLGAKDVKRNRVQLILSNPVLKDGSLCFDYKKTPETFASRVSKILVELSGIEPLTPCLQSRCSTR